MTDKNQYFYLKMGIPRGPFSWHEFVQLAKNEKIKAKTACIRNDELSRPASIFFGENWNKIASLIENKNQQVLDKRQKDREELKREREQRKLESLAEHQQEIKQPERKSVIPELQPPRLLRTVTPPTIPSPQLTTAYLAEGNYQTKSVIGIIGSGCLILGVFLPILRLPFIGSMDYLRGGTGDGVFVMALGAVAIVMTLCRTFRLLWLPGVASLGIMAFSILNFFGGMAEARRTLDNDLEGNPFRGIGEAMIGSVSLEWGWIVLIGGGVLVCVAAGLKPSVEPNNTGRNLSVE